MSLRTRVESLLLPFVERPMRYTGGEVNSRVKSDAALRGVLCFPDLYDIGMSHHGSQILYHIVNRHPRWSLSRAFHPWPDAEIIMRREGIGLWDLEYFEEVSQADWIGFSIGYELQYTGVLNMLDLAGIAVRSADRRDGGAPLVLAGGPCMMNPEPIAPFCDALVIGDGERAIERICEVLEKGKERKTAREALLRELGGVEGVYVPSHATVRSRGRFVCATPDRPVRATRVPRLHALDYPQAPIVPLTEVVHHRLAVEVMRGCTRGCRFCAAGMFYRPVRERASGELVDQIRCGLVRTGFREVGLLSLSSADYTALDPLLEELRGVRAQNRVRISLPSTRIDALTDAQLEALNECAGASSFTIAPEAGSERLRRSINKGFTDREIVEAVDRLARHGIQTIKLYFMVGLPAETGEDIDAIVSLVERVAEKARSVNKRIRINVAVSPFSPKPWTPFQWEAMTAPDELDNRGRYIKHALAHLRNVAVSYRAAQVTLLETILGRGDRRIADVIEAVWRSGGRLEGWDEFFDSTRWEHSFRALGVEPRTYTDALDTDEPLPWHVCDIGVGTPFLLEERARATAGVLTADCRGGECGVCGICTGEVGTARAPCSVPRPHQQGSRTGSEAAVPTQAAQGVWYRCVYTKLDRMRFLGHRDMTGVVERALSCAGVPMVYTRGFSPHPRLAFGPPLPLGVAGEREGFDALLRCESSFCDAVNALLPRGLALLEAVALPAKPVSLSEGMIAARYRFEPLREGMARQCEEALERFAAAQEVYVVRRRKGGEERVNIRPLVEEFACDGPAPGAFSVRLCSAPGATCTPFLLLQGLDEAFQQGDFLITRTACELAEGGRAWPL